MVAGKNMSTTTTTRGRKEATRVQIPSSLRFQTRSKRRRRTEEAVSLPLLLPRLEDFVEAAALRAKTTNTYNHQITFYLLYKEPHILLQKSLASFSEKNARET